jgi:hypothetical protein
MFKRLSAISAFTLFMTTLFMGYGADAAMPSLSGVFKGPFGSLNFKESADGTISGRLRSPDQCKRKTGTVVFTGSKLDDSVTGSLKACFTGSESCSNDEVNAPILLLLSPDGNKMTGVAHLPSTPKGCVPVLKSEGVIFTRGQQTQKKYKAQARVLPKAVLKKSRKAIKSKKKKALAKVVYQAGAKLEEASQLMRAGKAEAARAVFMEVIENEEKKEVAYNGLGVTFYMRERYDEAMKAYKKAVEINPMYPDPYYNLACLYALKSNANQAFRFLNMAFLNGYIDDQTLDQDHDLDNIRADPRFQKLKEGTF